MEEQQAAQLSEEREKMDAKLPTQHKHSAKYLNNKKVFEKLIQQKKYSEAHALR